MDNLIGKDLGRYHILEQLGEGGMAIVYKAYDTRLESDVAVKVIRMENLPQSGVERALKRFEREAKALAKLTHPNIVPIIDYGEYEGSPYLVMKYLPGGTLKQRLGQPMPYQEAARILAPIARALEYAHQHDIVHRDVKPSNILITESGQPMLSDFGVAKILEAEETMDLTGTGMGVGTPEYMAPEQANARTVDQRADIYSLGVVFYEIVTGRKPFEADTPMAVMIMQARDPLPPPHQFVRGLPETVEKVLFKALAKKPEDRYKNMDEFATALERLVNVQIVSAGRKLEERSKKAEEERQDVPLPSAERRQKSIKWGGWVAIGVLLILVAIGAAVGIGLKNTGQKTIIQLTRLVTQTPNPYKITSLLPRNTITLQPTLTPLPIDVLKFGSLLYQDDFSTDTGVWSLQKGNLIQNGEIILAPGTNTAPNWNTDYSDFIFETEFRFIGSTTGWSGMSVYLRYSDPPCDGKTGNCSDQVVISTQGTVSAWRPNGTDSYDQLLSDTYAPGFAPNGENQLTVIVNGNEFQIFLNHVFVRSFKDSTYKSGIIVLDTDGTSVAFNYIRIYAIP